MSTSVRPTPKGSTFDGKTLPVALIDFAAASQAPIRGDRSELQASMRGMAPLQTQENEEDADNSK